MVDAYQAEQEENDTARAFQLSNMARALAYLGRTDEALDASRRATERLPSSRDHMFGALIANNHCRLLAMAGQRDEAIRQLEEWEAGSVLFSRWQLKLDPDWDFFRDDERFNAIASPENHP